MPVTLFVDGIAKTVTSEQLERLFQSFHPSQVILASHRSGTSLGFAFVLFSDEEQAAQALQHLQGVDLAGSRISPSLVPSHRDDQYHGALIAF